MSILKRKKERKYFGYDAEQLNKTLETLCGLADGIDMTDAESEAMDMAIRAVCSIQFAMGSNGKVQFDD